MSLSKPSRRHFTEAARLAAVEAKRRKREVAVPIDTPEVFVVRRPVAGLGYGWEIRRFGAVVLDRSVADYSTMQGARAAGEAVLGSRKLDA